MKVLWAVVCASLMMGAPAMVHAGAVEDALAASVEDAQAGRCDDAVGRLSKIDGLLSRALLLGGRCRVDQSDYVAALSDFENAEAAGGLTDSQIGELNLYRAIALFHLERYADAETALDAAKDKTSDAAQLALYRGMVALRRNDNERAAPELESAARLSPGATEPVASYYAGLAWQGAAERTKAREAFQRVIEIDPDGPWGKEAAKLLESTKLFPFFVRMRVGAEYDDNVLLRATGTDQVTPDGDKDWRGVWQIDGGVQLYSRGNWAAGLLGSYSGSKQHQLDDFDFHFPNVGTFLDYRFGPMTISRLRYNFGFAWVDNGSFLRTQSVQASLTHTWRELGTTEVYADVAWNDFRFENDNVQGQAGPPGTFCAPPVVTGGGCGPVDLDEGRERDRDGYGLGAAVEHRYRVSVPDAVDEVFESIVMRGGYRFEFYDAQGTEWERFGNTLFGGFKIELPFDVSVDGLVAWEHYDYLHRSTYPDNELPNEVYVLDRDDREEDAFLVEAEVEKDLGDYVSVSARYSYYDNSSNRRVYDYRRHIVGAYVNFRID